MDENKTITAEEMTKEQALLVAKYHEGRADALMAVVQILAAPEPEPVYRMEVGKPS